MNTYFNGVRPIFRNWIAVIQHIFCRDTSSVFSLLMCWWIRFTVPFISSTQRRRRHGYLHSSLPLCPHLPQKPLPPWERLTPFISFDLPDETNFLVSLSELCFIMSPLESHWDQQPFSQKPLNKNEFLNEGSVLANECGLCLCWCLGGGVVAIPWQFPELWFCLSLNHRNIILSLVCKCSHWYSYSCTIIFSKWGNVH